MNSNSNHETLYGVGLLDDLHNYFPALLYDSSSFESVQDVLGYIHQQTRNRFDLFSYGLREYQSTRPQQPVENSYRRVVRTSFGGGMTSQGVHSHSTLRRSTIPVATTNPTDSFILPPSSSMNTNIPNLNTIQVELNHVVQAEEEEDEEEAQQTNTLLTNALLSLLQIPAGPLTRNYVLPNLVAGRNQMDQFLEPVVIRPTPQQIDANTTLGNLVSDTDHSCAICQDALTSEQEGRKLNACGHWFHRSCIDTWLQGNVHCPVCRHDIREPLRNNTTEQDQ
jgi:hypothetical protein